MADFKLRLSNELADRFDGWAGMHGGRSPALRHLISQTCSGAAPAAALGHRPTKLTVRLTESNSHGLTEAAAQMGLTPNAWVAALVRRRLCGKPRFSARDEVAAIDMLGEVRRIGVNVNQIARALNTAVMEGKVLDLELAYLNGLRAELAAHMVALREAFEGNLAYWEVVD